MNLGVIVKVSKLCNLRCVYCYETPELSNKTRMSLQQIERMFLHLSEFWKKWAKPFASHRLQFIWHGGEPFAQPIDYWSSILQLQKEVLGESFVAQYVMNSVQSNGTLLTERHLPLLQNFDLGISYDVLNEHRVDTLKRSTDDLVRRKIDWLRLQRIRIGGIAVISKSNIDHPQAIAEFFLKRGMSFRALPIYKALDLLPQIRELAAPFERYFEFYQQMMPVIREAPRELTIEPLSTARVMLDRWRSGEDTPISDQHCKELEWVIAVNTDGTVYSPGDCYFPEYAYGNIFTQSMEELLFESEGRKRRIAKSTERIDQICHSCFLYRRGCNGTFVSHATPEEYRGFLASRGCYHKALAESMLRSEQTIAIKRPEYSRETFYLNLTYKCNSRCLFCAADVAYKKEPRSIHTDQFSKLLDGKRYFQIALSGGEPTIHPNFLEIARLSAQHAENVILLTHGRSLSNIDFAKKVLDAGVTHFVIPLYGMDASTHDFVSDIRGSFEQTIRGFKNLEALRKDYIFSVELKTLLTKYTAPLNRSIYRMAKNEFPDGFNAISICPLIYSKSTIDHIDRFSASFRELKKHFFVLVREIENDGRYLLRINQFPPCFFRSRKTRMIAHPNLQRQVSHTRHFYADDRSTQTLSMNHNAKDFYSTATGNGLLQKCRLCFFDQYCSEKQTPYFAAAYLERFGETEFNPIQIRRRHANSRTCRTTT